MSDPPFYRGAPRWLKMSAMAVGVVALLLVILVHGGSGPHHHMPFIGGLSHGAVQAGTR